MSGEIKSIMEVMEELSSYQELCKFAEKYELTIELEKPFTEFPNLFLRVLDEELELAKMTLANILELDKSAAKILNMLSQSRK